MLAGLTQILMWGSQIAKGPTREIKGGPGVLLLRGDLNLGGDYEPQICHVEVPMLQLGPFSYWFSLVLVTYGA